MEERKKNNRNISPLRMGSVWIVVLVFIALLSALTYALIRYQKAKAENSAALTTNEPIVTEEPTETPGPVITEEPAETPAPTAQPQSFVRTAIVVDGQTVAVLTSREAAEELLREVEEFFRTLCDMPDSAVTETDNSVELVDAAADEPTISYDEPFAYLTSDRTPLKITMVVTWVVDEVIPHRETYIKDSNLPVGLRLVTRFGRDGIKRVTNTNTYVNGRSVSKVEEESFTVIRSVGGQTLVGTAEIGEDFVLTSDYGADPAAAMGLVFSAPVKGEVTAYFGPSDGGFHQGIDIVTERGGLVRAACSGVVAAVMERGAYGLMAEIDHGDGVSTRYALLSEAYLTVGARVVAGDVIGRVSDTEESPILHFELRVWGMAYNPLKILSETDFSD